MPSNKTKYVVAAPFAQDAKNMAKQVVFFGFMVARSPYDTLLAPAASRKLKAHEKWQNNSSLESLVELSLAFDYHGVNFKPYQVKSEIARLLKIVKEKKPKVILEIGTAKGGTLFLFSRVAPKDARIISLDFPLYPFERSLRKWRFGFFKGFAAPSQRMDILWRNSHKAETFNEIKSMLNGKPVDFLFIDGDHSYEGVKQDFEMYSRLVAKNGIIAFHDIAKHPAEQHSHVDVLFNDLQKRYKTLRLVENEKQGWGGIGVILLGKKRSGT